MRTREKSEIIMVPSMQATQCSSFGAFEMDRQHHFTAAEVKQEIASRGLGFVRSDVALQITTRMTDVLTENYHKRRKAGEILPTNAMTLVERAQFMGPLYLGFQRGSSYRDSFGRGYGLNAHICHTTVISGQVFEPLNWSLPSDIENQLATEALASVHSQGLDALTTASEFHKTLAMIAGIKGHILRIVSYIGAKMKRAKKGKRWTTKDLVNAWSTFESYWLEYRFGWRILYFDMMELWNWLKRKDEERRLIVGRASYENKREHRVGNFDAVTTLKAKAGIPATLDPSKLGYGNIFNTAWDIIPFSLIIDWFFTVQETILAHFSNPANVTKHTAAQFLSTTVETTITLEATISAHPNRQVPLFAESFLSIPIVLTRKERKRLPSPELSFPSFTGGPVGFQWLDLATLTRALIGVLRK